MSSEIEKLFPPKLLCLFPAIQERYRPVETQNPAQSRGDHQLSAGGRSASPMIIDTPKISKAEMKAKIKTVYVRIRVFWSVITNVDGVRGQPRRKMAELRMLMRGLRKKEKEISV